jgi:hypothetical protein
MPEPAEDTPDAIFHVDGAHAQPTELARGPWSPDAQHGGAPAALLARAVERCDPGPADFVARMTIELLRPVPLTRLEVTARTLRPGKKVQLVEASLHTDDGTEVARATALRLRTAALELPVLDRAPAELPPPEAGFVPEIVLIRENPPDVGFWKAVELRIVRGTWTDPGPASVWFRLCVPVVAGEEPSPLQRVATAADFGNGISAALERGKYLFINPDLTIYLHRPAEGEWVALDARTHAEANGVGIAESALFDRGGRIGRSVQALLIDRL